jgi:hypothetical protein
LDGLRPVLQARGTLIGFCRPSAGYVRTEYVYSSPCPAARRFQLTPRSQSRLQHHIGRASRSPTRVCTNSAARAPSTMLWSQLKLKRMQGRWSRNAGTHVHTQPRGCAGPCHAAAACDPWRQGPALSAGAGRAHRSRGRQRDACHRMQREPRAHRSSPLHPSPQPQVQRRRSKPSVPAGPRPHPRLAVWQRSEAWTFRGSWGAGQAVRSWKRTSYRRPLVLRHVPRRESRLQQHRLQVPAPDGGLAGRTPG